MKNPNLACDIFKLLLTEHISNLTEMDDCFTNKPETYLDKYAIDKLITSSFSLSDQVLARIDADPEIIAIRKKQQALAQAQQVQKAPVAKPEPAPAPKK